MNFKPATLSGFSKEAVGFEGADIGDCGCGEGGFFSLGRVVGSVVVPLPDFLTDLGAHPPTVEYKAMNLVNHTRDCPSLLIRNIETRGRISEVDEFMKSEKDTCRTTSEFVDDKHDALDQNLDLAGCKEGQRSATKDHKAEIMVSDDEGYNVDNVLAGSSHYDGSIYKNMELWWKTDYCIADRNENLIAILEIMLIDSNRLEHCQSYAMIPKLTLSHTLPVVRKMH
ncbi:hypothetical protein PR202_ga19961 [Eleusine coracana subsp. coracana]|uniref:Uncharacterized protein n=1 Tax=Eleusine coracana subsp. coracana TaxID=191504 RepID=A0AAV5CVD5_ELECO|nr:hypothetical protein PR202_ga19961 [Eleusine coracana subsp. coracana]